jgi:hypothetical protein
VSRRPRTVDNGRSSPQLPHEVHARSSGASSFPRPEASVTKPLDPYGDTVVMDDDKPKRPSSYPSNEPPPHPSGKVYSGWGNLHQNPPFRDEMPETLVCPTMTQTILLPPRTVIQTVQVPQPMRPVQVTEAPGCAPAAVSNAVVADTTRTVLQIENPPLPRCRNMRPSTEFRSFVYISVNFFFFLF